MSDIPNNEITPELFEQYKHYEFTSCIRLTHHTGFTGKQWSIYLNLRPAYITYLLSKRPNRQFTLEYIRDYKSKHHATDKVIRKGVAGEARALGLSAREIRTRMHSYAQSKAQAIAIMLEAKKGLDYICNLFQGISYENKSDIWINTGIRHREILTSDNWRIAFIQGMYVIQPRTESICSFTPEMDEYILKWAEKRPDRVHCNLNQTFKQRFPKNVVWERINYLRNQ